MYFFIVLAVILIGGFILRKLSGFLSRVAKEYHENKAARAYHQEQVARSLAGIHDILNPPEEPEDYRENLLKANESLVQKKEIQNAIKDQLGIE